MKQEDLRVVPKYKGYVVLRYTKDNEDKIHRHTLVMPDGTKKWSNKSAALKAKDELIALIAKKKVIVADRHKFKVEYEKYALNKLAAAEDPTIRLSLASVKGYETFNRKYIAPCFPDVYIDEVSGPVLRDFVKCIIAKQGATWKVASRVVSFIKTFLRHVDGEDMDINASVFNWKMANQYDIQPEDDNLYYPKETTPIQPDEAKRLINNLYENRNKDFYSYYKFISIITFIFTGLRFSELKGVLKKHIDLVGQTIFIDGVFDHAENRRKNKTKRRASKRHIDIQDDYLPHLTEWLEKTKSLDNDYLFPSLRTKGPISAHKFRTMVYMAYEENGLAVLKWNIKDHNNINGIRNTGNRGITKSFKVISSPFKDCPTKTFRHALATHLVNAVQSDPNIDQNYVMNAIGHGQYKTTTDIYGSHNMRVSSEQRAKRRASVKKAMNLEVLNEK